MTTDTRSDTVSPSSWSNSTSMRASASSVEIGTLVETRQFTSACEIVSHGVGVAIVSALDAERYQGQGLVQIPFSPNISHRLSLVRPVLKQPSMVTLEFIEEFASSLKQFEMT